MSTIRLPDNEDVLHLAALIYGEATVHPAGVSAEMKAIGWSVRDRFHHVNTDYGGKDAKWFGKGTSYRSIIEHGDEFIAADGPRYARFLKGLVGEKNEAELSFARSCIDAATEVFQASKPETPGRTGEYPYIWFQRGKTSPNPKRASADPARLGSHYFWSFAPGKERG